MPKNKFIFIYLFTGARVGNKKILIYFFFIATNFYQRQSWNFRARIFTGARVRNIISKLS
jgi:hypothetical protein